MLLDYTFKNPSLFDMAMRHPSVPREDLLTSYERLEFLGDAVLGMIVSAALYQKFSDEAEGSLAKRKAGLVNGDVLAKLAAEIGIDETLVISESEESAGGRSNKANLENAFEAYIGALYLDSDISTVESLIMPLFAPLMDSMHEPPVDPKTALQEFVQAMGCKTPQYRIVGQSGPAHAPLFSVEVLVDGESPEEGEGSSKKEAERLAASRLLKRLKAS